ncbi:hypothetical protein ACXYMX_00380 [Sporosarcina sp. CAU 1771]
MIAILKLEYDITPSTFRYVESLWFNYTAMISKMRDIELDSSIQADVNSDIKAKGLTSDPTAAQVFKLDYARQNKQYEMLEKNVKIIEGVFNDLKDDYKRVAQARYFTKHSKLWDKIAMETGYSKRQAIRIRDMIVLTTAERMSLW